MKNKRTSIRLFSILLLFAIGAFVASCKKNSDPISAEGQLTAANEASVSSQTGETDDMASSALTTSDQPKGGRIVASSDYRFACATLTFDSTSNKISGSITIDFGTSGCTDAKGNTRKGKIIVTWEGGRWYVAESVHTITFNGYSINGVAFSDSDIRTLTNVSTLEHPLTWKVVASHHLTWPDASTAIRTVHQTRQWALSTTLADDNFIISQTADASSASSGTNRHGKEYSVQITTAIEYNVACALLNKVFLPVIGTEVVTYDGGKTLTIDFGTGTCDNTFTLTESGHTKSYSADNSSSN